jgi:hypothetical protein
VKFLPIFAWNSAPLCKNFFSCWGEKIYSPDNRRPVHLRLSGPRSDVPLYCNSWSPPETLLIHFRKIWCAVCCAPHRFWFG